MINFPLPQFDRPTTRTSTADIGDRFEIAPVYGMAYNESPHGPSPKAVAAIQAAAGQIGTYPTMGDESLREALAGTIGRGLTADHFVTGCSGYEVLELVARAYLRPGDELITLPPAFGAYNKLAKMQGATVVPVPLSPPDFVPDVAAVLTAVSPRTRLILLCNPNNPTGTYLPASQMARLLETLPPHVTVVSDDVYHHFVTATDYPDNVQHILDKRPLIRIETFSKAYGMAGLRLGFGIARPDIASYIGGFHRGFHQPGLALAAGVAALADPDHLQKNISTVINGRSWLYQQFDRLGLAYIPSQTNFIVVHLPTRAKLVADALLPFGVMVRPLKEPGLENSLRVTILTPEANQQFIHGLETGLQNSIG